MIHLNGVLRRRYTITFRLKNLASKFFHSVLGKWNLRVIPNTLLLALPESGPKLASLFKVYRM